MSKAIDAFLDTTVQLVINTDQSSSYATIGTTRVPAPAPTPGPETGGWLWVLLLDARDSSIVLNTRFASPDGEIRACAGGRRRGERDQEAPAP